MRLNDLEFAPNVAAVLFMAGFIRTMQLVRQPLFDRVGADAFPTYETAHNRLFFLVARPGVLATFLSGVLLLFVRSSRHPFLGGPGARRAG